jgi:hypothetical protein
MNDGFDPTPKEVRAYKHNYADRFFTMRKLAKSRLRGLKIKEELKRVREELSILKRKYR